MEDLRRLRSEIQRPAANIGVSDDRFTDVFGGAPRSIFSHHLSAASCFYDDIFWPTEKPASAAAQLVRRRGRNLPLFDIPSLQQVSIDRSSRQRSGFFSDIFGWDATKMMSWRSRSKTNSSSVLSSEELSPVRFPVSDDVSLLASKLRPINIKTKWDSHHKKQPLFSNMDCENEFLEKLWGSKEIEENLDIEQMKFRVTENDDVQFNSPSSAISNAESCEIIDEEMEMEMEIKIDEDELMSSYVIELDSCSRDTAYESTDVDEAIAWAKDRIHKYSSQEKPIKQVEDSSLLEDDMSILDEKIRLWLTGKESDIRLLLSSLHHILWPNSGWIAIPLMNLMESSQVKKAYQKSVLCLHPDKLQQRGASLLHKYIAEKAFVALQDAWTTFTSLDVSCR
ncbi:J domain-containing protein required for chloroplast accumulation response 1-like [Salvia hispanica]|uniref:J domain-containing protein required for chloroplast accumulation response 1-like n=1 Tax=Salvia hispanica TaxID=49212 RepID=UPI002009C892|nr:J domain-containing protein required for chloroplast accumulation response 1-like [Salvia hispanica]